MSKSGGALEQTGWNAVSSVAIGHKMQDVTRTVSFKFFNIDSQAFKLMKDYNYDFVMLIFVID